MNKTKKTAIILLSGGLDSVVSIPKSCCDIKFGLIFDYGQLSFSKEKAAAQKIADYYKFPLISVKLDWLREITKNGLFLGIAPFELPASEYTYIISNRGQKVNT